MFFLKSFLAGFVVKSIASFDDTVTKIPVITSLTQTREGKIAFAVGNLGAVAVAGCGSIVDWYALERLWCSALYPGRNHFFACS